MEFIDEEHEMFFVDKINKLYQLGKNDVYYQSLVYTLGICKTTRENFDKILNIEKGEINIDSISTPWQTETSSKVTRMAFSLFNNCMYDSEQDLEHNKMSQKYNPGDIFCCNYAPYLYECIKLRYPEYTKEKDPEMEL